MQLISIQLVAEKLSLRFCDPTNGNNFDYTSTSYKTNILIIPTLGTLKSSRAVCPNVWNPKYIDAPKHCIVNCRFCTIEHIIPTISWLHSIPPFLKLSRVHLGLVSRDPCSLESNFHVLFPWAHFQWILVMVILEHITLLIIYFDGWINTTQKLWKQFPANSLTRTFSSR